MHEQEFLRNELQLAMMAEYGMNGDRLRVLLTQKEIPVIAILYRHDIPQKKPIFSLWHYWKN